jgi:hypothetical protein
MEREKIILNSFFIFKKKKDWVGTHTHTLRLPPSPLSRTAILMERADKRITDE